MAEIIWTEPALDDMDEIAGYIEISNMQAANKLLNKIFQTVERLEQFPESGRLAQEITELNYREVIVNPCRIFYQIEDEKIFIVRVIRQERDLRNYLIQESGASYTVDS